jgi:CBS domain containing-hemolysin-like protein
MIGDLKPQVHGAIKLTLFQTLTRDCTGYAGILPAFLSLLLVWMDPITTRFIWWHEQIMNFLSPVFHFEMPGKRDIRVRSS